MRDPTYLRERHGEVFALELPDGQFVPFRLLSLGDYLKYSKDLSSGVLAPSVIENEIYEKCVLDEVLVDSLFEQKAGSVTTIASTILQYSAPNSSEELAYFLNYNREVVGSVLYEAVSVICMAFSGYTPDDILGKDIHEVMLLLALAEKKLLETGVLAEPLNFSGAAEREKPTKKPKPKVDLSKLKEEYNKQQAQEYNVHKLKKQGESVPKQITEDETPHFNDQDENGQTVISGQELAHNLNTDPTADSPEEKRMIEEAKAIYGDYLKTLQKGEKIKMKSEDERLAEAKKRMAENRKRLTRKRK